MRILIVNSHGADLAVGGTEKSVHLLWHELDRRGHDVGLLAAYPGGELGRTTVLRTADWRDSRRVRAASHLGDWLSLPRAELLDAVREHAPDVVHTHNLPGIGAGIWGVCERLEVPVVHTLHDYHLLCPRVTLMRRDGETACSPHPALCGLRTRRLGRFSGAVSALTGVSQHVLDVHEGLFPRARRELIRNPFERPNWRRLAPPSTPLRTLGYIGSLDRIKGVHVLLEALPALLALGVEVRIAGAGRLAADVRAACERPGAHYHGVVEGRAKEDFFEACDVGIMPSLWNEPGGPTHVVVEWLAAGRPVFVSPRGGLAEIAAELPGVAAAEPTTAGIVEAVTPLVRDEGRWSALVGEVEAPASTTLTHWAGEYEAVLQSAVDGGSGPSAGGER